jgi:hypothetical protein
VFFQSAPVDRAEGKPNLKKPLYLYISESFALEKPGFAPRLILAALLVAACGGYYNSDAGSAFDWNLAIQQLGLQ